MASKISIDMSQVDDLFAKLQVLQYEGMSKPLNDSAKKLAFKLKQNVLSGQDSEGKAYPTINPVTLDMPIKRDGYYADQRIRGDVSQNRVAMNVTGKSADSINAQVVDYTEVNVGFDSERSALVFESNARHQGNSLKPKRDPLGLSQSNPTDEEFEIVADSVEEAVDRIINGF